MKFSDAPPQAVTKQSRFTDYNPKDLQRAENASKFTDFDPNEKRLRDQYRVPEKSVAELKSMSPQERYQYAQDLKTEREFLASKSQVKGAISGVTASLSEYVPGLSPEEDDVMFGFGELLGSAAPFSFLYNHLGKPLVQMAARSPWLRKNLMSLAQMTGFGLTRTGAKTAITAGAHALGVGASGAAIESVKHGVREGEIPSFTDVLKWGGQWAALDGALQAVGKGISYATKMNTLRQYNKRLDGQKVVNETIEQLAQEKISPEIEPERAAARAEEILDERIAKAAAAAKPGEAKASASFVERIPEEINPEGRTPEHISQEKELTGEAISKMPEGNRKKVTQEAFDRGMIRSREQFEEFGKEYDDIFPSLKGKTNERNRKFLNKYANSNIERRLVEPRNGRSPVEVKATPEQRLEMARTRKREARHEADKEKRRETQSAIEKAKKAQQARERVPKPKETPKIEGATVEPSSVPKTLYHGTRGSFQKLKKGKNGVVWYATSANDSAILISAGKNGRVIKDTPNIKNPFVTDSSFEVNAESISELKKNGYDAIYQKDKGHVAYFGEDVESLSQAEIDSVTKDRMLESVKRSTLIPHDVKPKVIENIEKGQLKTPQEVNDFIRSAKISEPKLEINKPREKAPEPATVKIPEPIIETTGEGAEQRHAYNKSRSEEIVDTIADYVEAAKTPLSTATRASRAINQGIANYLAPLERLEVGVPASEQVTSKVKQALSAMSEVNNVIENGIWDNVMGQWEHESLKGAYGDLTWKKLSKGLKEGEGNLKDLDTYRTSRIALKRQGQGKKTGVDTEIAKKDVARLEGKYKATADRIRDFQAASIKFYGKDTLGQKGIAAFNDGYYSSMYRLMDNGTDSILKQGSLEPKRWFKNFEGSERKIIPPSESDPFNLNMLIRNAKKNEAILAYIEKVQKGELPGRVHKGEHEKIPNHLMEKLELDPELEEVASQIYAQTRREGFTPSKNTLRAWKDGKPIDVEVPEDVYDMFKLTNPEQQGMLAGLVSFFNRKFSTFLSSNPVKFASIYSRDALSSLIYSRTGSNPISVVEALGDIYHNREVYKQYKALGGDLYAERLATRTERVKKINDLITPGSEGIIVPFEKMWTYLKKYPQMLNDIGMSVPLAEYKRALQIYGDTAEGRVAAAMAARKVSYDPTRKGGNKIVRGIANYVPFWNVSIQDLSMLGQNLKNKSTWVKGISAMSIPTLALKFYNDGNPNYEDLNAADKAAFWHFFTPAGHVRIPIPWLLGTTFKVGAEVFYDMVKMAAGKGSKEAKESWKGMYENFISNVSGTMPPLATAFIEMSTGVSPASPMGLLLGVESKSPEVIPRRLKDLPNEFQYTAKTPQLAKWFGQMWGLPPVAVERVAKTFGTVSAAQAFTLTDEIAYWSGLAEDKRPESVYLPISHFVSENTPSRTKYQEEFYNLLGKHTRQKNARKINQNFGEDYLQAVNLTAYNKDISADFKEIRRIEDASGMDPKVKRERIENLHKRINKNYKEAVEKTRRAKEKS
jgi:hypothetical protein